ncbi:MAG: hypothetical protein ABI683_11445 [Ginsengibacter sp.]
MKTWITFYFMVIINFYSCGQSHSEKSISANKDDLKVGGNCETCEAIYESPVAFDKVNSVVQLPDYNEYGPKMVISGTIYKRDGKTPAPGVVLYVYHTDQTGHYTNKNNATGPGSRHGYIRGWIRSDAQGHYKFYTLRPAIYPERNAPAHIHPIIKEPGISEYWIDEFVFDDDTLVNETFRKRMENRGGPGVIKLQKEYGILTGHRDIILGLNVTGYPTSRKALNTSGLKIGSNCPAFDPLHISGVDAGKKVCPMCKYGYGEGIMIWINNSSLANVSSFAIMLENEIFKRSLKNFHVFLIYMKPASENEMAAIQKLTALTTRANIRNVAVTLVPSATDKNTAAAYNINPSPDIFNTVFVYKRRVVTHKFINLDYDQTSFEKLMKVF